MKTIIEAELIENGDGKPDKTILGNIAEIAEKVSKPFDSIPGGQRYAQHFRDASVVVKEIDGTIESVKPLAKQVKDKVIELADKMGLTDLPERSILRR